MKQTPADWLTQRLWFYHGRHQTQYLPPHDLIFPQQFLLAAGLSYEKSSRATNVTYTAILFGAFSDHFFFGVSPSVWSVVGSSLILGAAITMAMSKADPVVTKDRQVGDGEEERGLMRGTEDDLDEDRMPIQELQMRTIR